MEIVTARSASGEHQGRRRRKASDAHVVAQLLDSPLPTPRRSCCGSAACTPRSARAASPQRTHVPFSWESSPGVPKAGSTSAFGGKFEGEVLPPRPPPGRRRGGIGMGTPCHARAYYGNATTDATSSDEGGGGSEEDTFSDALDRISSSDRLAALSARMSSVDGGAASRRLSSFIMERFLPAANAIATTSTEKKRAKRSPRRGRREHRSVHDDDQEDVAPAHARRDVHTLCCRAPAHELHAPALRREDSWEDTPPRQNAVHAQHDEEARGEDMSPPRACGFLVLFPWSVKPVLCGFPWSPTRPRTPRRSSTLGDVMVKENGPRNGDLSHWYEEKITSSGRREWSSPGGPGLGMSILGTSRRYCADARKALSRLARSATDGGGGSPRMMSREGRSGKAVPSPLHSTSGRMPQLSPPSESWLRHARGSNTQGNSTRTL